MLKGIRHTTYDNKSRKGEYIEITVEKDGKTKRYTYPWDPRYPYDYYVARAESQLKGKKQFNKVWKDTKLGKDMKAVRIIPLCGTRKEAKGYLIRGIK